MQYANDKATLAQETRGMYRYFKINAGVFLFGGDYDYWFQKYQYN